MSVTNSGREIILQAILGLLGDIGIGDGYNTSPTLVTRGPMRAIGEVESTSLPALWVEDGPESCANLCSAGCECTFDVWIHGYMVDASETSAGINAFLFDVKRALHLFSGLDATRWQGGKGQVVDASLPEVHVFRETGTDPVWGLSVRVKVEYREPLALVPE